MNQDSEHVVESDEEQQITRALRELPQLDLSPLAARALLVAAQRRFARREEQPSWLQRQETTFLIALSAAHLAWALAHVLRP